MLEQVQNFVVTVLSFVLVLAPLVFFHELGHFLVAKWFGIGVPVFSVGFGPRLFGFRRRETDYRVSLIPLGGYVRLTGDESDEHRTGAPEEFLTRPKHQRFLVFVAGAAFNIILAFLVLWLMFGIYGKNDVPARYLVVVGLQQDSAADRAGVLRGDTILQIAGRDVGDVERFLNAYNLEIRLAPNTTKTVLVERGDEQVTLKLTVANDDEGGGAHPGWVVSWAGENAPMIETVIEGMPADDAGLMPGDRIVAAQGREAISEIDLRVLLEDSAGQELTLGIERDAERLSVALTPVDSGGQGKVGVTFSAGETIHRELGIGAAAVESLRANVTLSRTLFVVLKRLFTGQLSLKAVSGPIGIARFSKRALFEGPDFFLHLLGFFSLQLGILNLLPIPVLDGGHILILAVEGVMGRDLPERLKERVMQVGLVFLLVFMSVVIYLDIVKTL